MCIRDRSKTSLVVRVSCGRACRAWRVQPWPRAARYEGGGTWVGVVEPQWKVSNKRETEQRTAECYTEWSVLGIHRNPSERPSDLNRYSPDIHTTLTLGRGAVADGFEKCNLRGSLRGDDAVQWRVSRHLIMYPAAFTSSHRARHPATRRPHASSP
eukprot:scaffold22987_cov43-Phaeocystis_antarctica.AAC.4